jgi:hypothetical protein
MIAGNDCQLFLSKNLSHLISQHQPNLQCRIFSTTLSLKLSVATIIVKVCKFDIKPSPQLTFPLSGPRMPEGSGVFVVFEV